MLRIIGIVLTCLFFIAPAEARQHHKHHRHVAQHHRHHAVARKAPVIQAFAMVNWWSTPATFYEPAKPRAVSNGTIVEHPAGCPRVAFCGCGAAVHLGLGAGARHLWLAANWYKFPRSMPAPGMVAVRRHHVMVLEADLGGGVWKVYDANSGRHMTRIHSRSIAGYAVVNPRA